MYPNLLRPLDLGFASSTHPPSPTTIRLPNRVIMGSMHTGLEDRSANFGRLAAYYAERASAGLIITGGFAPNREGWLLPFASALLTPRDARQHRTLTSAVHDAGGRIALQILHAGRYSYHPLSVSASALKSPITPFRPRALSGRGVRRQIDAFVRSASLARDAGYDGVEIMGSEGYFINQFLTVRTNRRTDSWGGSWERRMRLPVEIVARVREAVGPDFIIVYRLSILDLVERGQSWDEVVQLGVAVERVGATIINSGIGWHEARVPTIVTSVPRAAFVPVTAKLKPHLGIPLVASNRINMPDDAEAILARGDADLVSLARPFLADPDWVNKASGDRADEINTCIACNQACLDHVFRNRHATCLVNPRAARETELIVRRAAARKPIAVVGSGPAGLAASVNLAARGHTVTLYEAAGEIGGQFNLAKRIPGKEEFRETLRYFARQLELRGVLVKLNTSVTAADLTSGDYAEVILATGVRPRIPAIPGIDHPSVLSYVDVISGAQVGSRVAVLGAGGIGFDVATFLTHGPLDRAGWMAEWGVDDPARARAGVEGVRRRTEPSGRQVYLLQRKTSRMGAGLGKTSGWVHRLALQHKQVEMITGVRYERIDDAGLHLTFPHDGGRVRVLAVDNVVVCVGQEPLRDLADHVRAAAVPVHLVGGADVAVELDAQRAIEQATTIALSV